MSFALGIGVVVVDAAVWTTVVVVLSDDVLVAVVGVGEVCCMGADVLVSIAMISFGLHPTV
jgi:hypothetical protein